eukprot:TRINITY_DN4161_c2_g2_i1.p2 TRINITY_DN4161_c2_g2~~TRINITY_DN4161_c2_g2_i1.p2  ORF type:complete len:210 (+),score=78.25 TRINITY_DN4161_c2_g2_i1:219-848(+)
MSTTPRSVKSVDTRGFALHSAKNVTEAEGDGFAVAALVDMAGDVRVQGVHDVPDSTASQTTCVSEGQWRVPDCVSINKQGDLPDFAEKFKKEIDEDLLKRHVEELAAKAARRQGAFDAAPAPGTGTLSAEDADALLAEHVEHLAAKAAAPPGFAGGARAPDGCVRRAAPPARDAAATPLSAGTFNECYDALQSVMAAYSGSRAGGAGEA